MVVASCLVQAQHEFELSKTKNKEKDKRMMVRLNILACVTICAAVTTTTAAPQISLAQAYEILEPYNVALMGKSADQIRPFLEMATTTNWEICVAKDQCRNRTQTIARWKGRLIVVPAFTFTQDEVIVSENRIIVRGEIHGTLNGPFLGLESQGGSFQIMTLDIHHIRNGKIVQTYHLENWASAIRQLSQN